MTVEGLAPKGGSFKASFTNVRRKGCLYMRVVVNRSDGDDLVFEREFHLKKEMNAKNMRGEKHNMNLFASAMDNFVNAGMHAGFPEAFLRSAWQRSSEDRWTAVKQCFTNNNVERREKGEQPDLFS